MCPRTNATVNQLVERHLELLDTSPGWVSACRGYHRLHIASLVGHLKAGVVDAHILDSFYAELRRCRAHLSGRRYIEHRTDRDHRCEEHEAKPCRLRARLVDASTSPLLRATILRAA